MTLKPFDRKDFGARGLTQYRIAESLVAVQGTGKVSRDAAKFLATVPASAIAAARAKYIAD